MGVAEERRGSFSLKVPELPAPLGLARSSLELVLELVFFRCTSGEPPATLVRIDDDSLLQPLLSATCQACEPHTRTCALVKTYIIRFPTTNIRYT